MFEKMSNAIHYVLLNRPRRSRRRAREQEVRRVHAHVPAETHATRTVSIVMVAMSCGPERPSYTCETIRILNVSHWTAEIFFAEENRRLNVRIRSCSDGEAHLDRAFGHLFVLTVHAENYEDDGSEQMRFRLCIFIRILRTLFLIKI